MIYNTIHRKLKIEQLERQQTNKTKQKKTTTKQPPQKNPQKTPGNSGAPEG